MMPSNRHRRCKRNISKNRGPMKRAATQQRRSKRESTRWKRSLLQQNKTGYNAVCVSERKRSVGAAGDRRKPYSRGAAMAEKEIQAGQESGTVDEQALRDEIQRLMQKCLHRQERREDAAARYQEGQLSLASQTTEQAAVRASKERLAREEERLCAGGACGKGAAAQC